MNYASNNTTHYRSERSSQNNGVTSELHISMLPQTGRAETPSHQKRYSYSRNHQRDTSLDGKTRRKLTDLEALLIALLTASVLLLYLYAMGVVTFQ